MSENRGIKRIPNNKIELVILCRFRVAVNNYQIYVQKCSISPKNPIVVVKNSFNQILLCVIFANFCASSWEKANDLLWPPPHLNGILNYQIILFTNDDQLWQSSGKVQNLAKISLFGGVRRGSNIPIHWKKLQSAPDDAPRSSK